MAERKKYIDVQIPLLGTEIRVLGTPEELHMRTIKLDMTRRLRGKGLTITFRILKNEGKLYAIPNKLELVKSYIRRMARKRTDYVEDSLKVSCADVRAIAKPLLITRKRVSRAVRKNLRNVCKEFIIEYVKERKHDDICHDLTSGNFQKELLPKLKKIYPLSFCDIRVWETKEIAKINLPEIVSEAQKKKEKSEELLLEESAEKEITKEETGE